MKITLTKSECEELIAAMYSGIENEKALADAWWDNLFNKPRDAGIYKSCTERISLWTKIRHKIIDQIKKEKPNARSVS